MLYAKCIGPGRQGCLRDSSEMPYLKSELERVLVLFAKVRTETTVDDSFPEEEEGR